MRLKPAIIMLSVFILVIGGLAVFVSLYEAPTTDDVLTFKEEALFPGLDAAKITMIEIVSPGAGQKPLLIERVGQHKWMMTQAARAIASNAKISKILELFTSLKAARGYATKEFANYELARPRYRVTATTAGGETHTVAFGTEVAEIAGDGGPEYVDFYTRELRGGSDEAVPHRYARVGGRAQVLIVKDALCPEIDQPPAAFREPALVFAETADEVIPLRPAHCGSITISVHADGKERTIKLAKAGAMWRVTSPVAARANNRMAAEVLELLCALRADSPDAYVDDAPTDLARYGLDKPKVTLELGTADGAKRHTVRFGAGPEGKEEWRYVQSSSRRPVLLVKVGVLGKALEQEVEFFRSRRVVEFGGRRVGSMTFVYGSGRPTLTVRRRPDDPEKWRLEGAVSGRAGIVAVALLKRVGSLTVASGGFVSEDATELAQYGLDKPRLTVTVKLEGAPAATVRIGDSPKGRPDAVYAKTAAEPSVVLVAGSVVEELSPDPSLLRSAALLEGFDRWGAFELEIARGKTTTKLVRGERLKWRFVSPEGLNVDYAAPSNFIARLAALAIQAWPADKPADYAAFGLDRPRAAVTIKTRPGDRGRLGAASGAEMPVTTFVLHFGTRTKDGRRCYVRLPSESNVYEIDAAILEKIERGALLFREKIVLKFDPRAVTSLRLEGGRAAYAGQKAPGGGWLLTRPVPAPASYAAVKNLLEAVRTLNAVELVAEDDLANPKYGLGKPHRLLGLIVEEERPAPKPKEGAEPPKPEKILTSRTLLVGGPAPGEEPGGRYAAIREDKIVFVLAAEDVKQLEVELMTPTVINILRGNVSRVAVVHRDGSKVEVARDARTWRITSHDKVEPDVAKIEKLVEEAGWIIAEAYVRYDQQELAKYGLAKPRLVVTIGRKGKLPTELRIGDRAVDVPPMPRTPRGGEDETFYHATGGGIPAVFLVTEAKVRALKKHVEDLIKKEPK